MIAFGVTFGPPESAPVVFHKRFVVFAVTFSFFYYQHALLK